MIRIDYDKCCFKDGKCSSCNCGGCVEACPTQAITRRDLVMVNSARCMDCGACVAACKHGAIAMI